MKSACVIGFLAALACLTAAETPAPRVKLGAYYFGGWSGKCFDDDGTPATAWTRGLPTHVTQKMTGEFSGREPVWGWREDTPEIMRRQIDLAADHGIAFFSFCWYWADNNGPINPKAIEKLPLNTALRLFLEADNNSRMEFCLLVANHGGFEITGKDAWRQAAAYWMETFKHPRYLRVDGKPLLIIFQPSTADPEGLAALQDLAKQAGFPGVAVAACDNGKPEDGFALRTHYGMIPGQRGISEGHDYRELVEHQAKNWRGSPAQPYIPLLSAGWDRRPWEGLGGLGKDGVGISYYFVNNTPAAFRAALESMIEWMDRHPEQITRDHLALVYAWNEIGEGGWLVPTRDDPGGARLQAIRDAVLGSPAPR